jgi:hypothetical protein
MIIIRSRRCERLLASAAGGASRVQWRNPAAAVFPTDVNNQIRLHPADMIAADSGTCPRWCLTFGRMCLRHVLLQAALLNERLATTWLFADMHACRVPGMLLHVVEHRILAGLNLSAFGTNKSTIGITNVSHLRSDCLGVSHLRWVTLRRLRFTFFVWPLRVGRLLPPTLFQPSILLLLLGRVVLFGTTVYFGLPFSIFGPGKGSIGAVAPDCISKRRQYFPGKPGNQVRSNKIAFQSIRWLKLQLDPRPRSGTERRRTRPVVSRRVTSLRTSTAGL